MMKMKTDPTEVAISVTVKDKAGNSATLAVTTIMLAKRTAGAPTPGTVTPGLATGDTRDNVTKETEFPA